MAPTKKKTSKVSKKATSAKGSAGKKSTVKKSARAAGAKSKPKPKSKKKAAAKKPPAKKSPAKKAPAKKTAAKKTSVKQSATSKKTKTSRKKSSGKKTSAKKAPVKKAATAAKKPTSKKTTAKKSTAKKTTAKKTSTKKSAGSKKILGKSRSGALPAEPPKPDANGYMIINGRRVRVIASKEGAVKKKPKPAPPPPDTEAEKQRLKSIKTSLSKKELTHFRTLLLLKRSELVGDLNSIETEALRSNDGDISHMPIHMADIGSDTYEQDFMLGLAENDRQLLREIDEALQRIEDRTFGVCQLTGNMIGAARLEAKPWAKYSIEAKRLLESGQAS